MLMGILKGMFLCCDDENYHWPSITNAEKYGFYDVASVLRIVYRIIIPTIVIGGILSNVVSFLAINTPAFIRRSHLYLRGLIYANIGVLLSWIPVFIRLGYGMGSNYASVFYYAHLELVFENTFATADVLILTFFVFDQYSFLLPMIRTCSRKARHRWARCRIPRSKIRSVILYSFIIGLAVSAPLTEMRIIDEQQTDNGTFFTLRDNTSITETALWKAYIWIMEIMLRFFPILIFVFVHQLVIKRFCQINAKKKKFDSILQKFLEEPEITTLLPHIRTFRGMQQVTLMTIALSMTTMFIITTLPTIFFEYGKHTGVGVDYFAHHVFSIIMELIFYSNHIFIYCKYSKEFREEIFKLLKIKYKKSTVEGNLERPVGEIQDNGQHGTTDSLTPNRH